MWYMPSCNSRRDRMACLEISGSSWRWLQALPSSWNLIWHLTMGAYGSCVVINIWCGRQHSASSICLLSSTHALSCMKLLCWTIRSYESHFEDHSISSSAITSSPRRRCLDTSMASIMATPFSEVNNQHSGSEVEGLQVGLLLPAWHGASMQQNWINVQILLLPPIVHLCRGQSCFCGWRFWATDLHEARQRGRNRLKTKSAATPKVLDFCLKFRL